NLSFGNIRRQAFTNKDATALKRTQQHAEVNAHVLQVVFRCVQIAQGGGDLQSAGQPVEQLHLQADADALQAFVRLCTALKHVTRITRIKERRHRENLAIIRVVNQRKLQLDRRGHTAVAD